MVDADDLVSTAEIAVRLNLASKEATRSWRLRYADFPEPVARLAAGHIYAWTDIERWAAATGLPRPGVENPAVPNRDVQTRCRSQRLHVEPVAE